MSSLWETMKKEYVYGGMTYRELAERYGVPESTVGKHARADLWRELRRERRLQLPLCAEEGEAVSDTAPTRRDERSESADEGSVGENEEAGMRNVELRCGFAAYENADSLGDASFIPTAAVSDTASPRRDERSESADEGSVGENEEAGMRNEELRCGFAAYENADSLGDASAYGATAVSKCVELGTERVTAAPYVTSPIAAAGTLPVRVTVTDSRGRTKAYSTNITVMPYTAPTLSAVTLCRSDADGEPDADGAYIAARATANVSSLGGQNTASMSAAWCVRGGEYGSETPLVNSTPAVLGGGLIDTQYTYSARITLTDLLGQTAAYECDIPTASVAFHLREGGRGAAFGKYAEADGELQLPTGWALRIGSAALDAASLAALLELLES